MTRIAVFCDGTWNSPDIPETTSVYKLQQAVVHDPSRGQISAYFPGVGTEERFDGPVRRFFNKYGGGAFGWGLDAKVKQAYQFIAAIYQPGDEIYLFGFSRGAYTARSVAGMIRKCGIVANTTPAGINAAFDIYRKRGARNHPDQPHILAARKALSPGFATSQKDLDWRGEDGSDLVKIAYVGVWDTVGARGVPVVLLGPAAALWNSQYKFHDMHLSSIVRSARHALAVDERRLLYRPALWDNLDGPDGLNAGKESDPLRPYQQVWFVGNHGIVGGSGKAQALASYPMMWVLAGAGKLALDPNVELPLTPPDPLVDAAEVIPRRSLLSQWRDGPHQAHELHPSVRERVMKRPDYRPACLHRLFPA